jgi:hypothetical protein
MMRKATTTLKVCDVLSREIAVLFRDEAVPGIIYRTEFHSAHWPSGVYFSVLQSGGTNSVRKMLSVK